jgi:hypothetical protein
MTRAIKSGAKIDRAGGGGSLGRASAVILWDDEIKGFRLRVSPGGTKKPRAIPCRVRQRQDVVSDPAAVGLQDAGGWGSREYPNLMNPSKDCCAGQGFI